MGVLTRLANTASRFRTGDGGNFAMMMAVVGLTVAMAAGYGINTAQMVSARSNLLAALDSAITSTARDLTTGKIDEQNARGTLEAFLFTNGGTAFASVDRLTLDSVVVDKATKTVSAKASIEVDMAFPLFGMANRQRITTESAALYSDRKIEVAMMLDVTGSMSGQRIRDLRTAANNAVDTFLAGQDTKNPRIRVALIPYADAVNAGPLANVVHVEGGPSSSGEPPALDDPLAASAAAPDRCATERKGSHQFTDASPYTAKVNRDYRLAFCPKAALMPLTTDRAALKARIDTFAAGGHTAGSIGIQWTWYMLSRQWADVLPVASQPAAHDPKSVAKYAILMTDGEFNTAFAGVPQHQNVRSQPARSRADAERLCAQMKRQGIEVFTIGFMLNQASAKTVLRNCASPDSGSVRHYFDTSSGDELIAAYQEIARNIERLAITR